jgi:hypothetical protein
VLIVVHRTPATAERCAELAALGAGLFEVDAQLRGPDLVVSHYVPLLRAVPVLEHDNWRFRLGSGPDPRLTDVLARIPETCDVLFDPKLRPGTSRTDLRAALVAAATASGRPDRFRVSTSDPTDLAGYRADGLRTWRTIGEPAHLAAVLRGGAVADEAITVRHTLLSAETVAALRERTGMIVAWTVNDPGRARRLLGWGVDGITTDRPDRIAGIG